MARSIYDRVAPAYASRRRPDPRIEARILAALGDSDPIVNVGAGTGSYEPSDRRVTAVEPSAEMIARRPPGAAPVVRARAEELPFGDDAFEAATAVLTVHHWPDLDAGLAEILRVASRRVAIVTFDPEPLRDLWLIRDYFPGILDLKGDRTSGRRLAGLLPHATSTPIPVPRDCTDLFFAALWGRPELFLDDRVVEPMWVWQRLSQSERRAGRDRLAADLQSGAWAKRNRELRGEEALDTGLRLVVSRVAG